jgi:hypothetical protein
MARAVAEWQGLDGGTIRIVSLSEQITAAEMQESIGRMQHETRDKHVPDRVPPNTRVAMTKDGDTPFLMTMMLGDQQIGAATRTVSASVFQALRAMGAAMRQYLDGHSSA